MAVSTGKLNLFTFFKLFNFSTFFTIFTLMDFLHFFTLLASEPLDETKLPNSTFSAKKVQLDAFRAEDAPLDEYQIGMDCTYRPNDVVPIIGIIIIPSLLISFLKG